MRIQKWFFFAFIIFCCVTGYGSDIKNIENTSNCFVTGTLASKYKTLPIRSCVILFRLGDIIDAEVIGKVNSDTYEVKTSYDINTIYITNVDSSGYFEFKNILSGEYSLNWVVAENEKYIPNSTEKIDPLAMRNYRFMSLEEELEFKLLVDEFKKIGKIYISD